MTTFKLNNRTKVSSMERGPLILIILLTSSLIGWLAWDQFVPLGIDYDLYPHLRDPRTGEKNNLKDFLHLEKVINLREDYINKTNSIERLHDLILEINKVNLFYINNEYANEEYLRASALPHANQVKCGQDLNWIHNELKASGGSGHYSLIKGKRGYELTQLIGSIGKPLAGLYDGSIIWTGSYERCKRLEFSEKQLKMRYCWSIFKPKWWPEDIETMREKVVIRVGSCLPRSCDTQSTQFYGLQISDLIQIDWPEFYVRNFELKSMFCLPDEESPLRQLPAGGSVFIYSVSLWTLSVIVASIIYEIYIFKTTTTMVNKKRSKTLNQNQVGTSRHWIIEFISAIAISKTIDSFKVKNNLNNNDNHFRLDTSWLNTLKSIMGVCVVFGHCAVVGIGYAQSYSARIDLATGARNLMFAARFLDTFIVLFAIFSTIYLMSKFNADNLYKPSIWFIFNAKTFLRLWPLCASVYTFSRLLSPYIGEGPWWDYVVFKYTIAGVCRWSSWWSIIPYFSSYFERNDYICNPPAWFLIVYLRLALLIPIIVYILHRLPNHWCRSIFALSTSLITNAFVASRLNRQEILKDEAFSLYGGFLVVILSRFQDLGTAFAYSNIGSLTVSCYFGYLMCMYKVGLISEWPKWLKSRSFLSISIVLNLVILSATQIGFLINNYFETKPTIAQVAVSNYIMSIWWPILNCLLILQTTTTIYNRTFLIRLLSHPFWTLLNKLNLCIYLIHWQVIMYVTTGYEYGPINGSMMEIWKLFLLSYSITLILAMLAHFLIEAPIANMLTILFAKLSRLNPTQKRSSKIL